MLALKILFVFFFIQNFEESSTQLTSTKRFQLERPKLQFPVTIVVNPCMRNPCKVRLFLKLSFKLKNVNDLLLCLEW